MLIYSIFIIVGLGISIYAGLVAYLEETEMGRLMKDDRATPFD